MGRCIESKRGVFGGGVGQRKGQTGRMRWDYRDNASRWREVKTPAELSTPEGLKDFKRARRSNGYCVAHARDSELIRHHTPAAAEAGNENFAIVAA